MDIWLNADNVVIHKCSFQKITVDKNPLSVDFSGIVWDLAAYVSCQCVNKNKIYWFITARTLDRIRDLCLPFSHVFYLRCFNKAVHRSFGRKGFQMQRYRLSPPENCLVLGNTLGLMQEYVCG